MSSWSQVGTYVGGAIGYFYPGLGTAAGALFGPMCGDDMDASDYERIRNEQSKKEGDDVDSQPLV